MLIERTSTHIQVLAPAKVNLFLAVLGKRTDCFHEIATLLCPLSLFDRLTVEATHSGAIEFELSLPQQSKTGGDPAWQIPDDASNLVMRAVGQLRAALGTQQGCRIRLEKQIPAAAQPQ